jgi:23S rRNA pseudouridine2457 synthase
VVLLNKPYGVLCQFTDRESARAGRAPRPTLADLVSLPDLYPAGRLDRDSEGLLVLTDDARVQHALAGREARTEKTYWVQVEGDPGPAALEALRRGIVLDGRPTRPARVGRIPEPSGLWPREPPIRMRLRIPTAWLEIVLTESRNRQVRRMTAALGHPTLRLVRTRVGPYALAGLAPGEWRREAVAAGVTLVNSPDG